MEYIKPLCIALSAYTALPMPQFEWDKRSLALSFCFLPVAGALIGLFLWLWLKICWWCGTGVILRSAVCAALPLLVTGGIHMDGFCDTVDALCSHQDREKCLEIMKDSRAGAFAVIFCGVYLLMNFGLAAEVSGRPGVYCLIFTLSRAVSVLSVTGCKNARGCGMLAAFQKPAARKAVRLTAWTWIAVCALCMDLADIYAGSGALLAAIIVWNRYHATARRRFGGITGDTSGYFVQCLELTMMAGMYAGQCIEISGFIIWRSF
ncbi:MAG: adenosylcobinamide-GDP ribazoletransferase [Pyramidobacter sp.]|nr:adenosylcobinamide-GDP ribazoletransferase [Pyramidobacter sp.]